MVLQVEEQRHSYVISPDGSIVWITGPEDYTYAWEEMNDNMPGMDEWD